MSKDDESKKVVKVITLAEARISLGVDDPRLRQPQPPPEDVPTAPMLRLRA